MPTAGGPALLALRRGALAWLQCPLRLLTRHILLGQIMSTWTINPTEFESYRERHGSSSLHLHAGRGDLFICKHHDAQGGVLVNIGTHAELAVTAEDFMAEFTFACLDESAYYFGSPEMKASAERQLNAQMAAVQLCIEQDRVVRIN